jgi:fibronectin type 3 domain-containing protein
VVNVVDVQLAVNMDLGLLACPLELDGGVCSALVPQIVNAALGQGCSATVTHSVSLTWTASVSANIAGYNVYRSTTSGSGYTQINSSLVTTTSYTDSNVTAGQTYYYVTTAVDASNDQSGYSNQAQATVPTDI